jgi:hypothetical protein
MRPRPLACAISRGDGKPTGLTVELDLSEGAAGRYRLAARSPTVLLLCCGDNWTCPRRLGSPRRVATVTVATQRLASGMAPHPVGIAASRTLDDAWRRILAWRTSSAS